VRSVWYCELAMIAVEPCCQKDVPPRCRGTVHGPAEVLLPGDGIGSELHGEFALLLPVPESQH
jgi:hypothetical protein